MNSTKPKRVAKHRQKQKLKPTERVVFFTFERLVDPATGEEVEALVPSSRWDKQVCNERGYKVGDRLMADLFKERNARFWRLAHAMAKFVRDNVDDFCHLTIHATLKRLQRDANIECDEVDGEIDLGQMGKHQVKIRQPRSLNFADMDDGTFEQNVWTPLCDYIAATYFKSWSSDQVAEAAEFWEDKSA